MLFEAFSPQYRIILLNASRIPCTRDVSTDSTSYDTGLSEECHILPYSFLLLKVHLGFATSPMIQFRVCKPGQNPAQVSPVFSAYQDEPTHNVHMLLAGEFSLNHL